MPANFTPRTGFQMKAYRNIGNHPTPVWLEVCEIGDLNIADMVRNIAELKRRCDQFTLGLPALIGLIGIEFRLHFGLGQTNYNGIRGRFFDGGVEEWAFMNGSMASAGNQGLTLPCIVQNFPMDQSLENVVGHDVRLCAGYMENEVGGHIPPYWYIVGITTTTNTTPPP